MNTTGAVQYRIDKALLIADKIQKETGDVVEINDIIDVLTSFAVWDDYTFYQRADDVYNDLGYEYDTIEGL